MVVCIALLGRPVEPRILDRTASILLLTAYTTLPWVFGGRVTLLLMLLATPAVLAHAAAIRGTARDSWRARAWPHTYAFGLAWGAIIGNQPTPLILADEIPEWATAPATSQVQMSLLAGLMLVVRLHINARARAAAASRNRQPATWRADYVHDLAWATAVLAAAGAIVTMASDRAALVSFLPTLGVSLELMSVRAALGTAVVALSFYALAALMLWAGIGRATPEPWLTLGGIILMLGGSLILFGAVWGVGIGAAMMLVWAIPMKALRSPRAVASWALRCAVLVTAGGLWLQGWFLLL
jgi:hypothetical protein